MGKMYGPPKSIHMPNKAVPNRCQKGPPWLGSPWSCPIDAAGVVFPGAECRGTLGGGLEEVPNRSRATDSPADSLSDRSSGEFALSLCAGVAEGRRRQAAGSVDVARSLPKGWPGVVRARTSCDAFFSICPSLRSHTTVCPTIPEQDQSL